MENMNITTRYSYDARGRLLTRTVDGETTTFEYDAVGQVTQTTLPNGSFLENTYDARGNLVTETTTREGITRTVAYAYNEADRLMSLTYPSGRTVDYIRNALGQIESVTTTAGASFTTVASTMTYQPFGPMDSMTYGNGLNRTHSYDLDYRLTAISTSSVLGRNYTYDMANNITAITNTLDTNRNQGFDYDNLNRLTGASGIYGNHTYSYDANGNRLTSVIDTHVQTYSHDTDSHHLLQTVNGGTRDYRYDANGNTIDNTDRQFSYGNNNRLKAAQVAGSPIASYIYNGKGERVKKQSTDITLYYYDQSGQLIAELDGFGNTLREYIYVDGQPLAYVTLGAVNFIHTDHLGTPQIITDQNQVTVWQADYEPFGNVNITTQTITYNQRFLGQLYDEETGLHYNYFRTYDPSIGRYIESDPIGLRGGMNTYLYVAGNPIDIFDQFGLHRCNCTITEQGVPEVEKKRKSSFKLRSYFCECGCTNEIKNVEFVILVSRTDCKITRAEPLAYGPDGKLLGYDFDIVYDTGDSFYYDTESNDFGLVDRDVRDPIRDNADKKCKCNNN